jgi:hypothetical protein
MRCLADFLIDSDLCLKPDAAPLRVKAPDNDFSLTLSNAGGPEAPLDAVLSGQLFFGGGLVRKYSEDRAGQAHGDAYWAVSNLGDKHSSEIRMNQALCASRWILNCRPISNCLTYATNRKFLMNTIKRVIDWTPGLTETRAIIYVETSEWDVAEPLLDDAFIDAAERILVMQPSAQQQAAMR